jgi:G3E family GTPase
MIKIDVISGFLGAGKTTLIKKLFTSRIGKEKVVLIENEFGEIGIDGGFLKESGVEIKEINSGCICCSLVGDFAASMKEVIAKYNPERIIVEPSGVGKLSDIINAIKKVDAPLQLNILATVVDGPKCKAYLKNFGEFFNNQVEAADTIIINKIDKMDDEKLVYVTDLIKEKNSAANVITTPICDLDADVLLNILEEKASLKDKLVSELEVEHSSHEHHHDHDEDEDEDHDHECCHHHHDDDDEDHDHECCRHHHDDDDEDHDHECCHHHHDDDDDEDEHEHEHHHEHHYNADGVCSCGHHHHDADEVFTSWGMETPTSISKEQLTSFLETLKNDESLGIIIRSKGILRASDNDKWYYFDYVYGDYEIRLGNPDYTGRVVVIGSKIDEQKIENLFKMRG